MTGPRRDAVIGVSTDAPLPEDLDAKVRAIDEAAECVRASVRSDGSAASCPALLPGVARIEGAYVVTGFSAARLAQQGQRRRPSVTLVRSAACLSSLQSGNR